MGASLRIPVLYILYFQQCLNSVMRECCLHSISHIQVLRTFKIVHTETFVSTGRKQLDHTFIVPNYA